MIKNDKFIYQQICENIRRDIVSGKYKSGQRIEIFKIERQCKSSHATVIHALKVLEEEKIIHRVCYGNNKGYYVSENPFSDNTANLNAVIKHYRMDMLTKKHLYGVANIIRAQYAKFIYDEDKHSLLDLCVLEISAKLIEQLAERMPDNTDIANFLKEIGNEK